MTKLPDLTNETILNPRDSWSPYNQSKNSLQVAHFKLKKSLVNKELLNIFANFGFFVSAIWFEVKDSFIEHLLGTFKIENQNSLSSIQRWFYYSTNGKARNFIGWIYFYGSLNLKNWIKYKSNDFQDSFRFLLSEFSSLPRFEGISANLFLLASFFSIYQASTEFKSYSGSQNSSTIVYMRKNAIGQYEEFISVPIEFKVQVTKPLVSASHYSNNDTCIKSLLPSIKTQLNLSIVKDLDLQTNQYIFWKRGGVANSKLEEVLFLDQIPNLASVKSIPLFWSKSKYRSNIEALKSSSNFFFRNTNPYVLLPNDEFSHLSVIAKNLDSLRTLGRFNSYFELSPSLENDQLISLLKPSFSFSKFKQLICDYQSLPLIRSPYNESLLSNPSSVKSVLSSFSDDSLRNAQFSWLNEIKLEEKYFWNNSLSYITSIVSRCFLPLFSIFLFSEIFAIFRTSLTSDSLRPLAIVPSWRILGPLANKNRLQNILGIDSLLPDLKTLFQDLKSFLNFSSFSFNSPKGYLFVGPPGTGKTKLAEAIAGEGQLTFIGISASSCVGRQSASMIRALFQDARRLAPCILFIDEIDSFGLPRNDLFLSTGTRVSSNFNSSAFSSDKYKLRALTEFLVQMDGIRSNDKIFVIGATNSRQLDPALIRPGRFDRSISFGLPNSSLRTKILKSHSKSRKFDPAISWTFLTYLTNNLSGASLEAIMNESLLKVIKDGKPFHTQETIQHGIQRITEMSILPSHKYSSVVKQQNPFYQFHSIYLDTAKCCHNFIMDLQAKKNSSDFSSSVPDSSVQSHSLSLVVRNKPDVFAKLPLLFSDVTPSVLLERSNFETFPISNHLDSLQYLLTSSFSDYFMFSSYSFSLSSSLSQNRFARFITYGNLMDKAQSSNLSKYILAKWSIFSLRLSLLDKMIPNQFSPSSTFLIEDFSSFSFKNILDDWAEGTFNDFNSYASLNSNISEFYLNQNFDLSNLSDSLRIRENYSFALLFQSQKNALDHLFSQKTVYHSFSSLLNRKSQLLPHQFNFVITKILCHRYLAMTEYLTNSFIQNLREYPFLGAWLIYIQLRNFY